MATPAEWYYGLPIVSRVWLTGAVLTGVGAKFGLLSPMTIAFIPELTFQHLQVKRDGAVYCNLPHLTLTHVFSKRDSHASRSGALC